jgi:hypothetical protein
MSNSPHHLEQALDLLAERVAEKLRKPAEPTAAPASDQEYLTPQQAAELLGVTDRTLEALGAGREGPSTSRWDGSSGISGAGSARPSPRGNPRSSLDATF